MSSEDDHEALSPNAVTDGRERKLDPRSIQVSRIAGGIFAAVVSGALLIGLAIVAIANLPSLALGGLLLVGWALASGSITALALWWPALTYRHTSYRVSARGMRIRRGVLWRTISSVPRSRVQHTDVSQGPIERSFGLATLVIYTAGTHHASISLGGLAHDTALHIRDHLIPGGEDDAV